jgi:hypothetical protein
VEWAPVGDSQNDGAPRKVHGTEVIGNIQRRKWADENKPERQERVRFDERV